MTDPVRRAVAPVRVIAVRGAAVREIPDSVAGEEPMEIRVEAPGQGAESVAVTMRTPGHDFELAVGFLATEGILDHRRELATVRYCELPNGAVQQYNVVTVSLRTACDLSRLSRNVYASSSCGICGKATIDQVAARGGPVRSGPAVALSTLLDLPRALRDAQSVFERTGGLHAAGVFMPDGTPVVVREDVGRHNAIDKAVGRCFLDGTLPLDDHILAVSGRVSFEVVQKAAAAGVPIIVAVSAPTSLAVEAAREFGQTLIAFARGQDANVYSGAQRIDFEA